MSEGDTGTFKGNLSVKVDEYEDKEGVIKHSAEVSLNNAKFEAKDSAEEPF